MDDIQYEIIEMIWVYAETVTDNHPGKQNWK